MLVSKHLETSIKTDKIKLKKKRYLLVPFRNWMTQLEAGVTGSSTNAPDEMWVLSRWIGIPFTYKVYERIDQKGYLRKRIKSTTFFLNYSFLYFVEI